MKLELELRLMIVQLSVHIVPKKRGRRDSKTHFPLNKTKKLVKLKLIKKIRG